MSILNWRLLVVCIAALFFATLYLFHFNRIIARIVSNFIRLVTWSPIRKDRIYVDIESLQVSLLTGRIILKDLRYHSSNQTINVIRCTLVWKYWLWPIIGAHNPTASAEKANGMPNNTDLPCRLHVMLEGVQWLMYNRMAAYDDLLLRMRDKGAFSSETSVTGENNAKSSESNSGLTATREINDIIETAAHSPRSITAQVYSWFQQLIPSFTFENLPPVSFEVLKAAVVCGNKSTPTLLLGQFRLVDGICTVSECRSRLDLYRRVVNATCLDCKLFLKDNGSFDKPMVKRGKIVCQEMGNIPHQHNEKLFQSLEFETFWASNPDTSHDSAVPENPVTSKDHIEYAAEEKLFECGSFRLNYIVDTAGTVPAGSESIDNVSPEWALNLDINGGILRYGPWADRQRAELQKAFFPPVCFDAIPTNPPRIGEPRLFTHFKILVEIDDNFTLQMPFRESSKNWMWDGRPMHLLSGKRSPASIQMRCGRGSALRYALPILVTESGYQSSLDCFFKNATVTSSTNDIVFIEHADVQLCSRMPTPLKWNDIRTWTFDITLTQPNIRLVRDYITMLSDLGKDWNSGPPSDFHRWFPVIYILRFELRGYALHFFANDHNIIDYPQVRDENAVLSLRGAALRVDIQMSAQHFRPESSVVQFALETGNVAISLSLQKWDTRFVFACKRSVDVGRIGTLRFDGTFLYHSDIHEEYVDTLTITVTASALRLKLFGWLVRRLVIIRDNYFGNFTNFHTLSEYLGKREQGLVGDPIAQKYREGTTNTFEVVLEFMIPDASFVMPAGFPGFEDIVLEYEENTERAHDLGLSMLIQCSESQISFRLHDSGTELTLNISPLHFQITENCNDAIFFSTLRLQMQTMVVIDRIDIVGHRLFGPKPHALTYFCTWDVMIGSCKGQFTLPHFHQVYCIWNTFSSNFSDILNSPTSDFVVGSEPTVTFTEIKVHSCSFAVNGKSAAIFIDIGRQVLIQLQNPPGQICTKVTAFRVPSLSIHTFLLLPDETTWLNVASLSLGVHAKAFRTMEEQSERSTSQLAFLRGQDLPTGRISNLLDEGRSDTINSRRLILEIHKPRPVVKGRRVRQTPYQNSTWQNQVESEQSDEDIANTSSGLRPIETLFPHDSPEKHDNFVYDSMSGGEESTSHRESDYEEADSDDGDDPSLVGSYRRYLSQYRKISQGFGIATFTQINDRGKRLHVYERSKLPSSQNQSESVQSDDANTVADALSAESSVLQITASALNIFLTPLLVQAAQSLLGEYLCYRPSLELLVDSLLVSYMSSQPTSDTKIQSVIKLFLPDPIVTYFQLDTPPNWTSSSAILSSYSLSLMKLTLGYSNSDTPKKLSLFRLELPLLEARIYGVELPPAVSTLLVREETVSTFYVNNLEISMAYGGCDAQLGCIDGELDINAPTRCLAVIATLHSSFDLLRLSINSLTRKNIQFKRHVLLDVLTKCRDKPILNPLSLAKPSYLVQAQSLRSGLTYNMLTYIRLCLAALDPQERGDILAASLSSKLQIVPADIELLIRRRWGEWTNDLEGAEHISMPLLSALYQEKPKASGRGILGPLTYLKLGLQRISVRQSSQKTSQSTLEVTSLSFAAQCVRKTGQTMHNNSRSQLVLNAGSVLDSSHLMISFTVQSLVIHIFPLLFELLQDAVRAHKFWADLLIRGASNAASEFRDNGSRPCHSQDINIECLVAIERFRVRASAQNLLVDTGFSGFQLSVSGLSTMEKDTAALGARYRRRSSKISSNIRELFVRARAASRAFQVDDSDVLASSLWNSCKVSGAIQQEELQSARIYCLVFVDEILCAVPRSATRTYQFLDEWRADYLPAFQSTIHDLLEEVKATPQNAIPSQRPFRNKFPSFIGDIRISKLGTTLQITHGVWLSWDGLGIIASLQRLPAANDTSSFTGELRVGSQVLHVGTTIPQQTYTTHGSGIRIVLPTFTLSGHRNKTRLEASAQFEYFKLSLKPHYFDDLLMVQKNLGSNYYDLLELIARTRRNATSHRLAERKSLFATRTHYAIAFTLKGFRIGVAGPTSTQFLDSSDIHGSVDYLGTTTWTFNMKDFSLSLAPLPATERPLPSSDVHQRSAFVLIDLEIIISGGEASLFVNKFHAVMSPSSVGELGDLLDYIQFEMRNRQEQRSAELMEIKSKTRSLLRTFEIKDQSSSTSRPPSWLAHKSVEVTIVRFGIAFPLALPGHGAFSYKHHSSQQGAPVRAFLLSISRISFTAQQSESGAARIESLSFQFVPQFNQTFDRDFDGLTHETQNRLLYPELSASIQSDFKLGFGQLKIGSSVSGFILDLDPSIVDYIFASIHVYKHGRQRLERFAFISEGERHAGPSTKTPNTKETRVFTAANILMSLHFVSGKVRLHSVGQLSESGYLDPAISEFSIKEELEQIDLPSLSVWGEFKTASRKLQSFDQAEPAHLTFKALIHSSRNILRPTLLQFLTQATHIIEHHIGQFSAQTSFNPPQEKLLPSKYPTKKEGSAQDVIRSLHVSFSIQIDQSQLELTCLPDVNVVAGLQWDSGGFLITIAPGSKRVSVTGVVAGLAANLKHGYLREKCAEVDARDLSCSVAFAVSAQSLHSLSIVIDTELSASLRLSRLQDILCFRAVWLDRIPILNRIPPKAEERIAASIMSTRPKSAERDMVTLLLLRARTLKLALDLGPNNTDANLNLRSFLLRTNLTKAESEIEVHIAQVALNLERNLVGTATTPDFKFHTLRRRHGRPTLDEGKAKTLHMSLISGTLDILLYTEGRRILHYYAQPVEVSVYDDLAHTADENISSLSQLHLVFSVTGGEIVAMATISTIPRLLTLVNRVRVLIEEQKEGAIRESGTFRYVESLKPKNPLTAVANALIRSAKTHLNEANTVAGYTIMQHMKFRLDKLQLAIFYRNVSDPEMALFTGHAVQAELRHGTDSRGLSGQNDLHLSLVSMSTSKMGALNYASVLGDADPHRPLKTTPEWLASLLKDSIESLIFKLPAMDIQMMSHTVLQNPADKPYLDYEFSSSFPLPLTGAEADTEVSLNISLYKWLAEFRTRLTTELALVHNGKELPAGAQSSSHVFTDAFGGLPTSSTSQPYASHILDGSVTGNADFNGLGRDFVTDLSVTETQSLNYRARSRQITRPTVRQLGDATPDILHPFFSKRAGFNVEEQLPVYIHEYATLPLEQLIKILLRLYSRQFKDGPNGDSMSPVESGEEMASVENGLSSEK